jgi:hypothetical protein
LSQQTSDGGFGLLKPFRQVVNPPSDRFGYESHAAGDLLSRFAASDGIHGRLPHELTVATVGSQEVRQHLMNASALKALDT